MVSTFGIVNVTRDSFSDGGSFLDPAAALAHARALVAQGADVIDLGAESTHPDAEDVEVDEQVARLEPVVRALVAAGVAVSVDTWRPGVWRALLPLGVRWLNCVHGFQGEGALEVAAGAPAATRFVIMFSRSAGARASRPDGDPEAVLAELDAFCRERLAAFARLGIARDRIVFDPGMGFFLGRTAAPSLRVLRHLEELQKLGVPLMISVSRKSVIGEVTGQPTAARGPGTLAAELWAARHGADWIRTHDIAAFVDAWAVEQAISKQL